MIETYRQCDMQLPIDGGYECTTAWIPAARAYLGNVLGLKGDTGIWSEGWIVSRVGDTVKDREWIMKHSRPPVLDSIAGEKTNR